MKGTRNMLNCITRCSPQNPEHEKLYQTEVFQFFKNNNKYWKEKEREDLSIDQKQSKETYKSHVDSLFGHQTIY